MAKICWQGKFATCRWCQCQCRWYHLLTFAFDDWGTIVTDQSGFLLQIILWYCLSFWPPISDVWIRTLRSWRGGGGMAVSWEWLVQVTGPRLPSLPMDTSLLRPHPPTPPNSSVTVFLLKAFFQSPNTHCRMWVHCMTSVWYISLPKLDESESGLMVLKIEMNLFWCIINNMKACQKFNERLKVKFLDKWWMVNHSLEKYNHHWYFSKLYFSKLYFYNLYFSKLYFLNCIFPSGIFLNCIIPNLLTFY